MNPVSSIASTSVDPAALQSAMRSPKLTEQQKIAQVGEQFEAIFIRQYLGESLKPMLKGGALEEEGAGSDTYRYFLTDMLATRLAGQHAFGIGQTITHQMSPKAPTAGEGADATTAAAAHTGHSAPKNAPINGTASASIQSQMMNFPQRRTL